MVIEIDQFDNLIARYGAHVAQLVNRKLSKILATKLRQEDTVAELAPARFVIVSRPPTWTAPAPSPCVFGRPSTTS
jgi:GGDEF domain-containing protein